MAPRLTAEQSLSCGRVVVFGRLPVAGHVKTRLAAGVGPAAAAAFYAACAAHALRAAAACGAECGAQAALYFSDANDAEAVSHWLTQLGLSSQLRAAPQEQGAALGGRLRAAFTHSLALPGVERVVVAGADVPELCAAVLRRALDALGPADLVLGPAIDGGYYLVGLTRAGFAAAGADLFDDALPWSTPQLLAATVATARAARLRVAPSGTLPTLRDVDTVEDLRAWCSERDAAAALPHALAAAALAALAAAGG
jgi:rSAM/selenodomain-associated transferase 1